ncbi:hypothetical protein [Amycolatopsis suaedae]|uniref:Esterase-like activity of phytase family protein n=1 Tax=Amycolatopsis suaedae TaxID=2510978 RepID=A0A4Q7IZL1_9PSEU|nr:hypothetical protein [Amycolatopsis suaedae]RZQ59939.1 hypothetical protein EWH70_31400 [Amycolatopsis suaedae]
MGSWGRTSVVAGVALLIAVGTGGPAFAAPALETVCTVTDKRLGELSGLVTDDDGNWYAISDGGTSIQVLVLGRDCAVKRVVKASADPYDVEDLARGADGTLWLGDIGDNRKQRDTIALHAVTPNGKSTLYRLTYPDGQHDAEALLLDKDGVPYVVTKNVLGASDVYRASAKLTSPGPTALEKVGTLDFEGTDTPGGPVGPMGSLLVTGGATSADHKVVALRTYTDAYLYATPDGDIAAALKRTPVRVPLPNENQGEAIAFEPDGTLLSGSEGTRQPIRAVRGATGLAAQQTSEPGTAGAAGAPAGQDGGGLPDLPGGAVTVAVGAAVVVLLAVVLLRRRRRV